MKKILAGLNLTFFLLVFTAPLLPIYSALAADTPENNIPLVTPVAPAASTACVPSPTSMCLNVPLPGLDKVQLGTAGHAENPLGNYIKVWYGFIIATIGIFATVMIMWGGFRWLTSRGDSAQIGKAKDTIFSAIIGLVLVFMSYTILTLINPALTTISMPYLAAIPTKNIPASNNTIVPFSQNDPLYPGGNDKGTIQNNVGCTNDTDCLSGWCYDVPGKGRMCWKKFQNGLTCYTHPTRNPIGNSSCASGICDKGYCKGNVGDPCTGTGISSCVSGVCNQVTHKCITPKNPIRPPL